MIIDFSTHPYLFMSLTIFAVFSVMPLHELGHAYYARMVMGAKKVSITYRIPGTVIVTKATDLKLSGPAHRISMRFAGILVGAIPIVVLGYINWIFYSILLFYLPGACKQDFKEIIKIVAKKRENGHYFK